jgi:hypothetical protein
MMRYFHVLVILTQGIPSHKQMLTHLVWELTRATYIMWHTQRFKAQQIDTVNNWVNGPVMYKAARPEL